MSAIKRYLEEKSVELGYEGQLDEEILEEIELYARGYTGFDYDVPTAYRTQEICDRAISESESSQKEYQLHKVA